MRQVAREEELRRARMMLSEITVLLDTVKDGTGFLKIDWCRRGVFSLVSKLIGVRSGQLGERRIVFLQGQKQGQKQKIGVRLGLIETNPNLIKP